MLLDLLFRPPTGLNFIVRAHFVSEADVDPWVEAQVAKWGWEPGPPSYCELRLEVKPELGEPA
jgi:hypothetical protein